MLDGWKIGRSKKEKQITIHNLALKMKAEQFDNDFIESVLAVFQVRVSKNGEREFQNWIRNLHYRLPEEFQEETTAIQLYEKCEHWIENELAKLEDETKLSWETQAADLNQVDEKARKAQLVIRHRLSEIVLELME